jgi:23S rRNA G2445 N2-methylase RlmL
VNSDSINSQLTHTPSIQSITKKAIIDKMTDGANNKLEEDENN